MKYVDEYRTNRYVDLLAEAIKKLVTHPWNIMEICGGQTHTIARYQLESFLPKEIQLLHGPGCPVCVTPIEKIDQALLIAARPEVIFTSFGDMLRVPGSREDLLRVKARGGDVRMVYSPLDAVKMAADHPDREVVFFAIGFETTAPVNLMAVEVAERLQLKNFSLLTSLFCVPPAIDAILSDVDTRVHGFLTAGHVCAITGNEPYHALAARYRKPMVVTGFEPVDILYGIYKCVAQLEAGRYAVENAYRRAVPEQGNVAARNLLNKMLEPVDQTWRGLGVIPQSGFRLRTAYAGYDADRRFTCMPVVAGEASASACCAGEIMRGRMQPADCPLFGNSCLPSSPVGAPMVSAEGVCAAYYQYNKNKTK